MPPASTSVFSTTTEFSRSTADSLSVNWAAMISVRHIRKAGRYFRERTAFVPWNHVMSF
jgi:hypothetical protein